MTEPYLAFMEPNVLFQRFINHIAPGCHVDVLSRGHKWERAERWR